MSIGAWPKSQLICLLPLSKLSKLVLDPQFAIFKKTNQANIQANISHSVVHTRWYLLLGIIIQQGSENNVLKKCPNTTNCYCYD